MKQPLASDGGRLHFVCMIGFPLKSLMASSVLFAALALVPTAAAQDTLQTVPEDAPNAQADSVLPPPDVPLEIPENIEVPTPEIAPDTSEDNSGADATSEEEVPKPDYSELSMAAERSARLDALFERLAAAETPEKGNLIAEEIWAIWLDSGSASVNLILRRGTAAEKAKNSALARQMYDHVLTLAPDYAEGWARSSRLALENRDFARAITESIEALTLEPRHFYALWTLGNTLEQLGRSEEALEAYREAHKLHPTLKTVEAQVERLEAELDGGVL